MTSLYFWGSELEEVKISRVEEGGMDDIERKEKVFLNKLHGYLVSTTSKASSLLQSITIQKHLGSKTKF